MDRTIDLNDQVCLTAVEVDDESPNRVLPAEPGSLQTTMT